ncbi:FAD/NAD P-binding domain-containing protein [Gloeophyllum trabeum ATCC 11539]|uniref:FAD/NAD P-binding domain-containing protein n=1 Tax=Gloeophyllum trabeum (strain ATCC 11539 / FP-39264 / Madison 617) TaxID=670483 RepID=S7RW29_GLOTA|nr:FAD/NAD P-binding domain-containing protein [Gloeophyllum trabeum ATCC 11539]EPQ59055.1 FAD/NAD P-binding domain-containing protein [Gloeophyllum trabeum ATCC 11539]
MDREFRVAIVYVQGAIVLCPELLISGTLFPLLRGGGIAGLVLAVALSKTPNIEVNVYEAAAQISPAGAGIRMFPHIWKIMRALGLDVDLAALSNVGSSFTDIHNFLLFRLRKSNQPEGIDFYNYLPVYSLGTGMILHRADFQKVILENISRSCPIHFSKRLVALTEAVDIDEPVVLHFEDGSTTKCDIAIGADGIKSAVRASVFGTAIRTAETIHDSVKVSHLREQTPPMWTGTVAYWGLIHVSVLENIAPNLRWIFICIQHLVVFSISQDTLINVIAFVSQCAREGHEFQEPWVTLVHQEELLSALADFEKEVQDLLHCIDCPSKWAIHVTRPLDSYVSEYRRVALLGEAAHAMAPYQASGAGQAIEVRGILNSSSYPKLTLTGRVHSFLSAHGDKPQDRLTPENADSAHRTSPPELIRHSAHTPLGFYGL